MQRKSVTCCSWWDRRSLPAVGRRVPSEVRGAAAAQGRRRHGCVLSLWRTGRQCLCRAHQTRISQVRTVVWISWSLLTSSSADNCFRDYHCSVVALCYYWCCLFCFLYGNIFHFRSSSLFLPLNGVSHDAFQENYSKHPPAPVLRLVSDYLSLFLYAGLVQEHLRVLILMLEWLLIPYTGLRYNYNFFRRPRMLSLSLRVCVNMWRCQ